MRQGRERDDERAWRFLLKQYGPLLRGRAGATETMTPDERREHWAALGVKLGEALS